MMLLDSYVTDMRNEYCICKLISPSKFHTLGICKIISPVKASVSAADVLKKEIKGFEFGTYIQPLRLPKWNANDTGVFFSGER